MRRVFDEALPYINDYDTITMSRSYHVHTQLDSIGVSV